MVACELSAGTRDSVEEEVPRWLSRKVWALILMAFMAAFHIYMGATAPLPSLQQRSVHLSLGLMAVFLLYPPRSMSRPTPNRKINVLDGVLVLVSAFIGVAMYSESNTLLRQISPEAWHVVMAGIATVLVLEGARRTTGLVLPLLGLIAILYASFGQYLGGLFQHSGSTIEQIAGNLFLSTEGILGIALGVSATYVILFVIFGSFLQLCGTGDLMLKLSGLLVGHFRGGQAKGATIASGLFGSISGSQVGNVASTGPVTIPLMKSSGFNGKTAGAVEAAASSGGMLMPPVMGAAAFLMAEILQIPYIEIVRAALLPAILYYVAILFTIDFRAGRIGIRGSKSEGVRAALTRLLLKQGYQLVPLALLIYLLVGAGSSPARAAFWGIVGAGGLILVVGIVTRDWKSIGRLWLEGATSGVQATLVIIMACAAAGIVMGMMGVTGLGFRLSFILTELAGSSTVALLLLTMLASIILGMSLPAVAAYLVLAVTIAPALINMGLEPIAAHMYVFYFGILSAITPPVALAAFTAAGISGESPHKTSFEAVRFALAGFLIPFMFVYRPALLMIGTPGEVVLSFIFCLFGIYALAAAVEGYLFTPMPNWQRIVLLAGAVALVAPGVLSGFAGLVVLALIGFVNRRAQLHQPEPEETGKAVVVK